MLSSLFKINFPKFHIPFITDPSPVPEDKEKTEEDNSTALKPVKEEDQEDNEKTVNNEEKVNEEEERHSATVGHPYEKEFETLIKLFPDTSKVIFNIKAF